jgi:hypothetical protein
MVPERGWVDWKGWTLVKLLGNVAVGVKLFVE